MTMTQVTGWTPIEDILAMSPQPNDLCSEPELPEPARTVWGSMPSLEELLSEVKVTAEDGTQYGTYKGLAFRLTPEGIGGA